MRRRVTPAFIVGMLIILAWVIIDKLVTPLGPEITIPMVVIGVGLLFVGRFGRR